MCALKIDPYAAKLHFRSSRAVSSNAWKKILTGYLEAVGQGCVQAGPCVIGHIKGLALGEEKRYLRVSVISTSHPAEVEGVLSENMNEVMFSINVIVYGLPGERLDQIVRKTATRFESGVVVAVIVHPTSHYHEHAEPVLFPIHQG